MTPINFARDSLARWPLAVGAGDAGQLSKLRGGMRAAVEHRRQHIGARWIANESGDRRHVHSCRHAEIIARE
jgi:hypothetical protein